MLKKMFNAIIGVLLMCGSVLNLQAQEKSKLSDLSPYTTLFVDVVGVMYDGITPYADAVHAINQAKKSGLNVIFISNNPRPSALSQASLKKMGVEGDVMVVTSGDYTRWYLQKYFVGKTIYHLGATRNQDILKDIDVQTTENLEEADIVLLSQFIDEEDSDTQFDDILRQIVDSHKPVFCANPDVYALYGEAMRKCAGFFAKKIEDMGGKVTYLGKPNPAFYEYVCQLHSTHTQDKQKILMIGDTLATDIKGANTFGIDSLLVLTGISKDYQANENEMYSDKPTFYMNKLN
jgi:HAD superfamily hydrolase (TIGR01459 family)